MEEDMRVVLKTEKDQAKEWHFIVMEIDFRDNF